MNQSHAQSGGIAKFRQRMQQRGRVVNENAVPSKSIDIALKNSNAGGPTKQIKKDRVGPAGSVKPKNQKMPKKFPRFDNFGATDEFSTIDKNPESKITPEPITTDNHGYTPAFAMQETFDKIQAKLDSAERKIVNGFKTQQKKTVKEFDQPPKDIIYEEADDFKSPAVSGRSSRIKGGKRSVETRNNKNDDLDFTPPNESNRSILDQTPSAFQNSSKTRMGSTDDQGNRLSNMPGEERPSLTSVTPYDDSAQELVDKVEKLITKSQSQKKKYDKSVPKVIAGNEADLATTNPLAKISEGNVKIMQSKAVIKNGGKQLERTNFVRLNANKTGKYKPALRGAAFTNKLMAKKSTQMKFRNRFQQKLAAERAANNVGAYGGLGAHGLDFGEDGTDGAKVKQKEIEGSFSGAAMAYAPKTVDSDEDELLVAGVEDIADQLKDIDEQVKSQDADDDDAAACSIPSDDQGYLDVLEKRFGHASFKEGQLKAVKLILEQKMNALVVLATGGGKSLCYQYVTQFLPGLILVVTPLISLMTDQLSKLPDFIKGAALNSQQSYKTKQAVIQAVQDKHIKVLFITPERLFMEDLSKFGRKISMVCVDEIHCSSEWSHNFRPAYLVLHEMIKEKLGSETRVIGLTATATRAAQQQICEIFDIKYPDHIVTQPDLSRLNLQLSITRDAEKTTALLQLLRSSSFKPLTSILIFATQRRTTDQIAQLLNQNGIRSASYHAGKTDDQRSNVQKEFIQNRTRVLCCTIAFSMGIDKSDIQSVIHYDVPRSIENYVQEIGRAGRDGTLARCHMFLSNDDFYQLRRITLSDLLDNQSALILTNHVVLQAKKSFYKSLTGEDIKQTRKRKRKDMENSDSEEESNIMIQEFEHEKKIADRYETENSKGVKFINLAEAEELEGKKLYVSLNVKSLLKNLDLKKEVVLTMLNQLEKLEEGKSFFRVDSILPVGVQLRFHSKPLELLVEEGNKFYKVFQQIAVNRQGIYRCDLIELAQEMRVKPYSIPKMLYQIQHNGKDDIAYELDQESFVLEFTSIPAPVNIFRLSQDMLKETRSIEKNLVQKLNCMYFASRKVSLPSIDFMLKKEAQAEDPQAMYIGFSKRLNDLINTYFRAQRGQDVELQIAGNQEERSMMMPLLYIEDEATKKELSQDMEDLLDDFQGPKAWSQKKLMNHSNRMKSIDVVKVLMGIRSSREAVQKYMYKSSHWAKLHEYDYEQVLALAEDITHEYYLKLLTTVDIDEEAEDGNGKRLKIEE